MKITWAKFLIALGAFFRALGLQLTPKVLPPKFIGWRIDSVYYINKKGNVMRKANIVLEWEVSKSKDVSHQAILVDINGSTVIETTLGVTTASATLENIKEGDGVDVTLTAIDHAGNVSKPASLSFVCPALPDTVAPAAPTFVGTGWRVDSVIDDEADV